MADFFSPNTTTTTQTPSYQGNYQGLSNALTQGALDSYNLPYQNYGGQLVAPLNNDQNAAFRGIADNVNSPAYGNAFTQGMGMISGAGQPSAAFTNALSGLTSGYTPTNVATGQLNQSDISRLMSPYLSSVVDTATNELDRSAGKNKAALQAQLAGAGAFGDRGTLALSEQSRNADQVKANTIAQLLQGGYGQALGEYQNEQGRGLQAAAANQSAGLQGQALNNQALAQAAGLDLSNRGLGVTAGTALGNLGTASQNANLTGLNALANSGQLQQQNSQAKNQADYNQFLRQLSYPAQQNTNLNSILTGSPKQVQTQSPTASTAQQSLGALLSGLGLLGGTGAFGSNGYLTGTGGLLSGAGGLLSNLFGSSSGGFDGALSAGDFANGFAGSSSDLPGIFGFLGQKNGGRVGYADGGELGDDEDDDPDYLDDEEQGPDAGPSAFDMGGEDQIAGGIGEDPIGGSSLAARARLSGFTPEMLQKAFAEMQPRQVGQATDLFGGGVNNPLTALGLGILSSKSPNLGEALGAGGQAALGVLDKQTLLARQNEAARQKQAQLQAQLIGKAVEGDNKALNEAQKTDLMEGGKNARNSDTLASKQAIADANNKARLAAAAGNNAATVHAAAIRAASARMSPVGKLISERDSLPEGDPRRKVYDEALDRAVKNEKDTELKKLQDEQSALVAANPNDPRLADYRAKIAAVTRPQGPEEEGATNQYYKEVVPNADAAANNLPKIQLARSLISNTGTFADQRKLVGGLFAELGLNGEAVNKTNNLQQLQGIIADVVLSKQLEQRGVQTESDANRMRETLASLKNTPEANEFLLRAAEAQGNRSMDRQAFFDKYYADNKTRSGADAAWKQAIRAIPLVATAKDGKPVFYNEYQQTIRKQNPSASEEDIMRAWVNGAKRG